MSRSRSHRQIRIRLGWIYAGIALVAVAGIGGSFVYQFQKSRNTQRILNDAIAFHQSGNLDRSIESYGLYLERNSKDVAALRTYASLLYDRLAISKSWIGPTVRALRELNRLQPEDKQTVERLVRLYLDLREFGLAEELARSLVAAEGDSPEAVLLLARACHGNNKSQQALKILTDAADHNPAEPLYYPPLIDLLDNVLHRDQDAEQWLRRGLAYNANAWEVQLVASQYFDHHGQFDSAQQHLERALELSPQARETLISGARFFTARSDIKRAGSILERAATCISPDDPEMLEVRKAYAISANDPELLVSVAGELQRAAETGNRAMVAQAAELYLRAGALPQADSCIESLEHESTQRLPKGVLDSLRGARALVVDQPYAALVLLESAVRLQPSDPWTLELLARTYLRTGAADEAADLYRRLVLLAPSPAVRLALARLEISNNRFDRAREALSSLHNATSSEVRQAKLLNVLMALSSSKSEPAPSVISELESIALTTPTNLAELEIMVHAMLRARRPAKAMDAWQAWPEISSTHNRIALDMGRQLVADADLDSARRVSQMLSNRDATCIESKLLTCELLAIEKGGDEAHYYVRECAGNSQELGELWELLSDKSSDPALKIAALTQAARLQPGNVMVRRKCLQFLDDFPAAQKVVDEIRALEGDSGIQWKLELASLLLRLDPSPEAAPRALSLLQECLATRSGWVAARGLLGAAYEKTGALSQAVESYRSALALNPDPGDFSIAFRLVDCLKRLGRFQDARAALATIARSIPESPDVQRLLTDQYIRNQDMPSAARLAQQVFDLDPNDESWAAMTTDLLLRAGQPARAETLARDALARHPDSATLVTSLAFSLLAQKKNDEALQLASQYSAEGKTAACDVLLARVLVEIGGADEAQTVLEAALVREPKNAALHATMADFWGVRGDRTRQIEFTRSSIQLQGEDPAQSLWLAAILASGSEHERSDAQAIVRNRISSQPDDPDALLLDAQLAMTTDPPESDRALSDLTTAVKDNPNALPIHKLLVAVYIQKAQLNAAADAVSAGLLAAPNDPDLILLSAEISQRQGDFERSMTVLRKLLERPNPPLRAVDLLTTAAVQMHQVSQAVEIIEGLNQRRDEENISLARLYEARGEIDKAKSLLQTVSQDSPALGDAALLRLFARQGDFDQIAKFATSDAMVMAGDLSNRLLAAELLASNAPAGASRQLGFEILESIAVKHPPVAPDARYRAGLAYLKQRDFVNAETMFLNVTQLAPLNPKAINALAWLYGEEMSNPDRGLDIIAKFEGAKGQITADLLDTKGTLLFRMKKYEEASQTLQKCLDACGYSPSRTSALYHLALVQRELGARVDAAANLKYSLQLNDRIGGLSPKQVEESRRLLNENMSNR